MVHNSLRFRKGRYWVEVLLQAEKQGARQASLSKACRVYFCPEARGKAIKDSECWCWKWLAYDSHQLEANAMDGIKGN
jgi:hypothetical protein